DGLSTPMTFSSALASANDAKTTPSTDTIVAGPTALQGLSQTQESAGTNATQTVRQTVQPSPVDQIKVQLSKSLKDGADTLSVQLHPEDLGRVDVKLEMQNGQVKATITADRPETLQLLKNDASTLQQSLNNAGLGTDANSLSFQLRGEQQQQQPQQQAGQNGTSAFAGGSDESLEDETANALVAAAALQRTNGGNNGIDINV
ncbi:MAG TPA: flagellar hook-length control protein FliK, partial [Telmatospirillum sp.]|nr:flagellar hook-length control protein FliK [Telmatospirillum sp.]